MAAPDLQGFLHKKSPSLLKGWQQRWFVLRGTQLSYFRRPSDVIPAGTIDVSTLKAVERSNTDPLRLDLFTATRKKAYNVTTRSSEERERWYAVLLERSGLAGGSSGFSDPSSNTSMDPLSVWGEAANSDGGEGEREREEITSSSPPPMHYDDEDEDDNNNNNNDDNNNDNNNNNDDNDDDDEEKEHRPVDILSTQFQQRMAATMMSKIAHGEVPEMPDYEEPPSMFEEGELPSASTNVATVASEPSGIVGDGKTSDDDWDHEDEDEDEQALNHEKVRLANTFWGKKM